ncbi:heat shock factor-binding protein 1-like [Acipenser oxyrinchus oxyrinchus]|uniref:Heat shock factor-binding protein 1-like n=1 Tax=Acipenser oxyrinchus oxyrinchus TaxID=40147 RepID=A0AAD8GF94_ACIOX|nr:heat shock factor-binding protein 1-like [Acipenser oxyrinchus oxyrinchus]
MKSKRDQHHMMADGNPTSVQDLSAFVETTMQNLQGKFQAINSNETVKLFFFNILLDEMGTRIDDLEKNVSDLMTLAGMDEPVEDGKVKNIRECIKYAVQHSKCWLAGDKHSSTKNKPYG